MTKTKNNHRKDDMVQLNAKWWPN